MVFKKKNLFLIGLIIFIYFIFSFYNSVFAVEDVAVTTLEDCTVHSVTHIIVSQPDLNLSYFKCEPGFIYTIKNNSDVAHALCYTSEIPSVGVHTSDIIRMEPNSTFLVDSSNDFYLTFYQDTSYFEVTREPKNGFDSTTNALINSVSLDNLWSVVPISLVVLGVLFAIGYIIVKNVLNRDSNVYQFCNYIFFS